ncbi:MAG: hypothetical protein Q9167_005306 [Letrouitia subvulpina]
MGVQKDDKVIIYSDSEECLKTIARWLSVCDTSHDRCLSSVPPNIPWPRRILFIDSGFVKLVETAGVPARYVTLSHCWGSGNSQHKLTKASIQDLKAGIRHEVLCKTYRDAIACAVRLSVHYIWIDSMCIVQDDDDDWKTESAGMSEVYKNSYITLCATRSENGDGGLFSDRWLERKEIYSEHREIDREIENLTLPGSPYKIDLSDYGIEEQEIFARLTYGHHEMDLVSHNIHTRLPRLPPKATDPLIHRAWAFQERLLASRIIDFRCDEIVWECSQCRWCECTKADRQKVDSWRSRFNSMCPKDPVNLNLSTAGRIDPRALFQMWNDIVTMYSRMLMTYNSDRLVALSGLAQQVSCQFESRYYGGLWERDFPMSLLWQLWSTDDRPSFFSIHISSRPERYRAPSWSWASTIDGLVQWNKQEIRRPEFQPQEITCHVCNVDWNQAGPNRYGDCSSASITLQGYLAEATISRPRPNDDAITLTHIDDGLTKQFIPDIEVGDPGCVDYLPPHSLVHCLEIVKKGKYTEGLVLKLVENGRKHKRIGFFDGLQRESESWQDDPWFDYEGLKQIVTII